MDLRVLFLFVLLGLLLVVPIGAADSYDISTDEMIDIADRERNVDGESFEITHISQIEQGNTLTVDTSGPDSRYEVNLISPQGQYARIENVPEGGDTTVEFDMSRTPGSWLIAITDPQNFVAIHPVVVKAYDVAPTVSETTVTSGTDVTADITVTEPAGGVNDQKDINRVEAVLANESTEIRVTADPVENEDDTYEASISTDDLAAGSYEFFGVVRGNQDIRGRDEVLGISGITEITVEESTTTTPSQPSNGGGTSGGGGGVPVSGGAGGGGGPTGNSTDSDGTSTDPDSGTDSSPPPTPEGDEVATVTTQRVGESMVEAAVNRNESAEPSTRQSMVAIVPTNISSESGAVTSNSLTIESQNVTEYSTSVSVQDTASTAPSTTTVGAVTVNHTVSDSDVTQAAFNISVTKSRLRTSNLTASEIALYRQHEGSWTRLNTEPIAETSQTVTVRAVTPGLSTFVLADESAHAAEITGVSINTTTLAADGAATVAATLRNPRDTTETYSIQFAVGNRLTNHTVSVGAGETTAVSHRVTDLSEAQRTHAVYVNDVYAGSITQSTTAATPAPTTTPADDTASQTATPTASSPDESVITPTGTPTTPSSGTSSLSGFVPGIFVVLVALLAVFTLRRS